jgi:hypothetical protein
MVRLIAMWLALVLAPPALAQPASAPPPAPAPVPAPAEPTAKPALEMPPKANAAGRGGQRAAASGPCIGVIPYVGDTFLLKRVVVFGNEAKVVPIHTWRLDDLVVARVRAAAGPRFAVRRLAYAKDAFRPVQYARPRSFVASMPDLKAIVEKIAKGAGCERYVLVTRAYRRFSNTFHTVGGVGIVNYGFSAISRTYLFAITAIVVYDGRTFAFRSGGVGAKDEENVLASALLTDPMRGPHRQLENFAWPPTPEAVTGLRDQARSLLADSLDRVLPALLAR